MHPSIFHLCKTTFIQYNPGGASKQIHDTSTDIIHAYRSACAFLDRVAPFASCLILEDDAIVTENAAARAWRDVDNYIASHIGEFDLYSLGSFGIWDRLDDHGPHRKFVSHFGFAQATIWTRRARRWLMRYELPTTTTHVDVHVMSQLRTRCYKDPLVVQLFGISANQNGWCFLCAPRGTLLRELENALVRVWIERVLRGALSLDTSVRGWRTLYKVSGAMQGAAAIAFVGLFTVTLHRSTRHL